MGSKIVTKSKRQLEGTVNATDKTCSKHVDNSHAKPKGHNISEWETKILALPVYIDILEMRLCRGIVTKVSGVINANGGMSKHHWDRHGQCWQSKSRMPEFDISFES